MVDLHELKCTDDQREAICHFTGPALVIAGPGSGKTFVLTTRIRYLVENRNIKPERILVITFTKSAAMEMKSRVAAIMGNNAAAVNFGTFHSVYFNILKAELGYRAAAVIKERDKYRLIRELLENIVFDDTDINELIKNIISDISRYKSGMYAYASSKSFSTSSLQEEQFAEIYEKYNESLKKRRMLDFDDMLLETYMLFKNNSHIRRKWAEKFDFIMIDEFQDIDVLQFEIIKLLLSIDENLFVVGDDDQSIYSFRGACPQIMLEFGTEFKGAKRIDLKQNFRCAQQIVDISLRLIENNEDRYSKKISAYKNSKGIAAIQTFDNKHDECEFLLKLIGRFADKSVAVLCRTNAGCGYYAEFFESRNIAYNMREKTEDIYAHFVVRNILSYIKIAIGAASANDIYGIINKPLRYVSREAVYNGRSIGGIAAYYNERGGYSDVTAALEKLEKDIRFIAKSTPFAAVLYIMKAVGYERYLYQYAEENKVNYNALMEKAYELMDRARDFKSLRRWIEMIELHKENAAADILTENKSKLHIATLHASKGLEYDVVAIMDIADGNIPYHRAKGAESEEEERRLLYVGMTRAKEALYLCEVKNIRQKNMKRSRFIENIAFAHKNN